MTRMSARSAIDGPGELPQAGELLAVEAIDRTGLIVTSEGAFVRIFRVAPPNPLLMSAQERAKTAATLPPADRAAEGGGDVADLRRRAAGEPRRAAGRRAGVRSRPAQGRRRPRNARRATRSRWRSGGCTRRLRSRCACTPTSRPQCSVSAYVVVPFTPRQSGRAGGAGVGAARPDSRWRRSSARCRRTVAPFVSISRTSMRCAPSSRRRGCRPTCLTASASCGCCGRGSTRPRPTIGRPRRRRRSRCSASSTPPANATWPAERRCAARAQIAQSSLDFRRSHDHVAVERDVEQTILVHNTVGRTQMGWLHGAMLTRQPFTLSVYIHALERRRERQKLKMAYRRHVHDQPRRRAARARPRLRPLRPRARVSSSCWARWPAASRPASFASRSTRRCAPAALRPTWRRCPRRSTSAPRRSSRSATARSTAASFASTSCGSAACRSAATCHGTARKYPTANTADMVPLVGTKCGSPTGIPFAFADPGRTVELLNPYDEEHSNHTMVDRRAIGSGQDDDRQRDPLALPRAGGARVRDRPRRPLRDAHPPGRVAPSRSRSAPTTRRTR